MAEVESSWSDDYRPTLNSTVDVPRPEQPANGVDVPEFKPCPFCGGGAWLFDVRYDDGLHVWNCRCKQCFVAFDGMERREHAVDRWNCRVHPEVGLGQAERDLAIAKRALVIFCGPEGTSAYTEAWATAEGKLIFEGVIAPAEGQR